MVHHSAMPTMEEESDSSSGTISSHSGSSPIVSTRLSPSSWSNLPAAGQLRDSGGSAMKGHTTPSPRQIPLFKFTPKSKTWKQSVTSQSPALSRPSLGVVPSSQDSKVKKKQADRPGLAVTSKQAENRLLSLLRSRFTGGKFHNVTVDKTELPHLARTNTTASKFVFANDSAKVRSKSLDKGSKRPDKGVLNGANGLEERLIMPNEGTTKNRTFTSSVKNLLQGNRQDKSVKVVADSQSAKKSTIDEKPADNSRVKENSVTAQAGAHVPKEKKELALTKDSSSSVKRPYEEKVAQGDQREGAGVPDIRSPKKAKHDSPSTPGSGIKTTRAAPKLRDGIEENPETTSNDQAPATNKLPILSISHKTVQNGVIDKSIAVDEAQKEESKVENEAENGQEEQTNKENEGVNLSESMTAKHVAEPQSLGPLVGIEDKWNNALALEPSNSFAQRQALVDLFTKLYQSNLLTKPKGGHLGDSGSDPDQALDREAKQPIEARIVTDLELFGNEDTNFKRPAVKPREKQHHLKGSVVPKEVASAKPPTDLPLEEEDTLSKAELHYVTESEDSSSDNENRPLKDFRRGGEPRDLSAEQHSASHVTLHENSAVGRPTSSGKDGFNQDPEIERRKINRELAINVMSILDKKSWFDRTSIINLVEPGIAKHAPMASDPQISVTNNICSAHNYEQSDAYYYQQMHKRGKLEFIPLSGPLGAKYGQTDKESSTKAPVKPETSKQAQLVDGRSGEAWKNNWRASLKGCYIFFVLSPPANDQDHSNIYGKQIAQLRTIFEVEFGVKVAALLDESVEIVISSDSSKASTMVEKIRHDPLKSHSLSKNLRVWSLPKAYQFVENMGIDVTEWTRKHEIAVETAMAEESAETPQKTPSMASSELSATGKDLSKARVIDVSIPKTKLPVMEASVSKVSVVDAQMKTDSAMRTAVAQAPAVEATTRTIPIAKSSTSKAATKKLNTQMTIDSRSVKAPARKVPVTKAFITAGSFPKSVASDVRSSRPRTIQQQEQTKTKTPGTGPPLLSRQIMTPRGEKRPTPEIHHPTGGIELDIGKTDTEIESHGEEYDFEAVVKEASESLEKKDRQIEAARKLILSLCQDVMKKELVITSLTGQLTDTQQRLKDREKKIEHYVTALVQKELQLVRMVENQERRAGDS